MAQYREDLGRPDLWFGIVQLATYDGADFNTWIPIQEAHRQVVENDPRAVLSAAVDCAGRRDPPQRGGVQVRRPAPGP